MAWGVGQAWTFKPVLLARVHECFLNASLDHCKILARRLFCAPLAIGNGGLPFQCQCLPFAPTNGIPICVALPLVVIAPRRWRWIVVKAILTVGVNNHLARESQMGVQATRARAVIMLHSCVHNQRRIAREGKGIKCSRPMATIAHEEVTTLS